MVHGSNVDRPVLGKWPEAIYWHHRFLDTPQEDLTDEEILNWQAWIENAENRLVYEKYCGLLATDAGARKTAHRAIPVIVAMAALIGMTFLLSSTRPGLDPLSSLLQKAPQGLRTLIPTSPPTPSTQPLARPDHSDYSQPTRPPGSAQRSQASLNGLTPSPREISTPTGTRGSHPNRAGT